jgi:hypothetical protein
VILVVPAIPADAGIVKGAPLLAEEDGAKKTAGVSPADIQSLEAFQEDFARSCFGHKSVPEPACTRTDFLPVIG